MPRQTEHFHPRGSGLNQDTWYVWIKDNDKNVNTLTRLNYEKKLPKPPNIVLFSKKITRKHANITFWSRFYWPLPKIGMIDMNQPKFFERDMYP